MAIELPHEVALFLNFCGIPYPDINEDQVHELARHVEAFATNVLDTHESATGVVNDMGSVYSGYSYQQLVSAWAAMSATHMTELDRACKVVAKALDIAADVIKAVKIAVLAELAALAASYAALLSASIATSGFSAAMAQAVQAAARKACSVMEQVLLSYLISEVIGKAIEPLEHIFEQMINGVVYDAARYALGVPAPDSSTATPLHIEPDEVLRYAKVLDDHADDIMKHAATFADNVAGLDFATTSPHDGSAPASADQGSAPDLPAGSQRHDLDPAVPSSPRDLLEVPRRFGESGSTPMADGADGAGRQLAEPISPRHLSAEPSPAGTPDRSAAQTGADRVDARNPEAAGRPETSAPVAAEHGGHAQPASGSPERVQVSVPAETPISAGADRATHSNTARPALGVAPGDPTGDSQAGLGWPLNGVPAAQVRHADPIAFGDPVQNAVVEHGGGSTRHDADYTSEGRPLLGSPPRTAPGSSSSSTPWGRAAQSPKQSTTGGKTLPAVGRAPIAPSAQKRATPWSKTERTQDVDAVVFSSDAAGPAPALRQSESTDGLRRKPDREREPRSADEVSRANALRPADRSDPEARP